MEQDKKNSFEAFVKCKFGSILFGAKNDFQNVIMTLFLITGLNALYLIFIFPAALSYEDSIFAIVCIIVGFSPIFTLLNVTMTEPGVLLKGDLPEPEKPQIQEQVPNTDDFNNQIEIQQNISPSKVVPSDLEQQIQDQPRIYTERYCTTCRIMRPSKASHCKQCNHCVEGFDHHCFWVGNCIGIRNWRAFNVFLLSATFATLFIGIQCIFNMYKQSGLMYDLWIEMFGDGSIPVISFYGLYFILGCWTIQSILNIILVVVMFFLPLIYSYAILNNDYMDLRYYENPYMTALILIAFLFHFLFAFSTCCVNWFHAALGKTAKQISSEAEYYMRKNQPISQSNMSSAQIARNLLQFITQTIPQSRYL